jgi:O-antigen/teichoic acid export membrane protein
VSALHGQGRIADLRHVERRTSLATFAVVFPVVVGFVIIAGPGLRMWLGSAATSESVRALQVLCLGVFATSMATVPFATLQGLGRADVTGKIHLWQLPLHLGVAWWTVAHWGVVGAAAAWTIRAVLDSVLMHWAAARILRAR